MFSQAPSSACTKMAMQTSPNGKIDRRTTVPFLLKLYYKQGHFHSYVTQRFALRLPSTQPRNKAPTDVKGLQTR